MMSPSERMDFLTLLATFRGASVSTMAFEHAREALCNWVDTRIEQEAENILDRVSGAVRA